jgi:hypothetical protein
VGKVSGEDGWQQLDHVRKGGTPCGDSVSAEGDGR